MHAIAKRGILHLGLLLGTAGRQWDVAAVGMGVIRT